MNTLNFIFTVIVAMGLLPYAHAQTLPTVEWYPPETEKSRIPERSKVVISGRTLGGALVQIDGDSVTVLNEKDALAVSIRQLRVSCKVYESPDIKSKVLGTFPEGTRGRIVEGEGGWWKIFVGKGRGFISKLCFPSDDSSPASRKIESRSARANAEGFFELGIDLPEGLAQIPILVTSPTQAQKTFMISVNVIINVGKEDDIKINKKTSASKPPAAAKKVRLWLGAGLTYQSYNQTTMMADDLKFQTIQAPGVVARGGYWGDRWGLDFYFRDAPGKIAAELPLQVYSDTYHWRTVEAKGLYQFDRGPGSRIGGLPSQWQLRFGTQLHQIPLLDIDNVNVVTIQEGNLTMATFGGGLLLGQERDWSYEFALGLQVPLATSGPGKSFSASSLFGYEAQIGAAYKFAPNWRLGLFSYTQSLAYTYEFQNSGGVSKTGKQSLFYTTFDLRLGYEF